MTSPNPTPTDVHLAVVLDESGSMGGLYKSTVDGFNQLLAEQQAQQGQCWVTLNLFNDYVTQRYLGRPIKAAPTLNTTNYTPQGSTALYDAVMQTIAELEQWLVDEPWFAGKVVVAIMTDGAENVSKSATIDQVNKAITDKRKAGWEFLFLGAGGAAWTEAKVFTAIPRSSTLTYHGDNMSNSAVYAGVSSSLTATRTYGATMDSTIRGFTNDVVVDQDDTDAD